MLKYGKYRNIEITGKSVSSGITFFFLLKKEKEKYEIHSKETDMNLLYIGLISILIHANML